MTPNRKVFLLACVSTMVGLLIAWIDTRPTWDDAGITAAMILGSSFCLGYAQPRFAWLWAILIGLWIPAVNIFSHGDAASSVTLLISFVGAYLAVLVRRSVKSPAT
jgi:hypothetical protein